MNPDRAFRLPVLAYHHVSDEIDYFTSVSRESFRTQIHALLQEFTCVSLRQALLMYESGVDPAGCFSLTFDDGYEDTMAALEYLSANDVSATVFLPSDHIGKDNRWNFKAPYISKILSKDDVSVALSHGHEIGSHSKTHQCLVKLTNDELQEEIVASRKALEELINGEVLFFAYPFGVHNEHVRRIARSQYRAAFAVETTAATVPWNDMMQIHRFSIYRNTSLHDVIAYVRRTSD